MLGHELQKQQVSGEVLIAEGIVMVLDIKQPEKCKDINAYLDYLKGNGPAIERRKDINAYFGTDGRAIGEASATIAKREGLSEDWLNTALHKLFSEMKRKWIEFPGLRIYPSPTDYLLAMKVAIGNAQDSKNIRVLAEKLGISNGQDILDTITKYIPEQLLTPEMRSLIEQTFEPQTSGAVNG